MSVRSQVHLQASRGSPGPAANASVRVSSSPSPTVPTIPPPECQSPMAEPTKSRLSGRLAQLGLHELSVRAQRGEFDDIDTWLAFPKVSLVDSLREYEEKPGVRALIHEVQRGDWDNTPEEFRQKARREGGL